MEFTLITGMMFAFAAALNIPASEATTVKADIAWVAEGEFCEPETVLPLPDNTLLVSNVCDFRKRGNGFLSLLGADGKALDWRIVEELDAPLGMAMLDQRLYVVDSNTVRILEWPGYKPLKTITLDTTVANDIAVSPDGVIYVTDTAKHLVMRVSTDGVQSVLTGEAQFKGANGIAFDKDRLLVGGARLWQIRLSDYNVETIGPEWLADIDGIELEADGTLQITPVAGPLIRFRDDNHIEVLTGPGVSSANHGYAAGLGLALIPTGFDNQVIAIRLND